MSNRKENDIDKELILTDENGKKIHSNSRVAKTHNKFDLDNIKILAAQLGMKLPYQVLLEYSNKQTIEGEPLSVSNREVIAAASGLQSSIDRMTISNNNIKADENRPLPPPQIIVSFPDQVAPKIISDSPDSPDDQEIIQTIGDDGDYQDDEPYVEADEPYVDDDTDQSKD